MFAYHVSEWVLYPFVGLIFGSLWAIILAYFLLPIYAYSLINKEIEPANDAISTNESFAAHADCQKRFKLLLFAIVEGLLIGYLFSSHYLSSMQPLAFLSPLLLGVGAHFVFSQQIQASDRVSTLGVCIGTGFAAHLILGFLLGELSIPYLVLTLLYTAIAYSALQIYFQYNGENEQVIFLIFLYNIHLIGPVFVYAWISISYCFCSRTSRIFFWKLKQSFIKILNFSSN